MKKTHLDNLAGKLTSQGRQTVVVISGPSGSGQTSLAAALIKRRRGLGLVRGTTTRARQKRRGGDRDHIFISRARFLASKKADAFLETDYNVGAYYGTSWAEIRRVIKKSQVPLLTLTVPGFLALKKELRFRVCSLFIAPENIAVLRARILDRQPDLRGARLAARLRAARQVLAAKKRYQRVIINRQGHLEQAIAKALKYVDSCAAVR